MTDPRTDQSTGALFAYLAHLAVPLFIALDEARFFLFQDVYRERPGVDKVILAICVLWFAAGAGAILSSRNRARFAARFQKPLVSLYAAIFVLVLLEGTVRVALSSPPEIPSLWPPSMQWVSNPSTWGVTGVPGTTRFTTNEIGLRGPALPREGKPYRIVTVGGSTTECLVLDDSKEWPHLVMEGLNARQKNVPVWLANAGAGGHTTVHHLMVLKSLPVFKQVDMVILLFGLNDLQASLVFNGGPSQAQLEQDAESFHQVMLTYGQGAVYRHPTYKRLRLYQYAERAKSGLMSRIKRTSTGSPMAWLRMWRQRRAAGKIIPLPDLRVGLDEYRQRIHLLAEECRTLHVRCLFLTQPVQWRNGLTAEEEASLWNGYVGPLRPETPGLGYVSAVDLEGAMDAYNHVLLDSCRNEGLECFDLASVVPKNDTVFYDDDHYTDAGARIVADRLLHYLQATSPFSN